MSDDCREEPCGYCGSPVLKREGMMDYNLKDYTQHDCSDNLKAERDEARRLLDSMTMERDAAKRHANVLGQHFDAAKAEIERLKAERNSAYGTIGRYSDHIINVEGLLQSANLQLEEARKLIGAMVCYLNNDFLCDQHDGCKCIDHDARRFLKGFTEKRIDLPECVSCKLMGKLCGYHDPKKWKDVTSEYCSAQDPKGPEKCWLPPGHDEDHQNMYRTWKRQSVK